MARNRIPKEVMDHVVERKPRVGDQGTVDKVVKLPVTPKPRPTELSQEELSQLSEAVDFIRGVRRKCGKDTAMWAYLEGANMALLGAISAGIKMLEGGDAP